MFDKILNVLKTQWKIIAGFFMGIILFFILKPSSDKDLADYNRENKEDRNKIDNINSDIKDTVENVNKLDENGKKIDNKIDKTGKEYNNKVNDIMDGDKDVEKTIDDFNNSW